ncbi:MAG: COX15/CtaA family protein [Acidobacteria bacterium]|nr:COX15/CtaA family protein [Acidobacteriota bacterium]
MSGAGAGEIAGHGRVSVARWLFVCAALVFAMVVLGGATRLTHSGLSIVEWQPLVGTIPPLSDADWQEQFEKYQLTPEYRLVNHDMDVEGFKRIFWLEYFHRLLGRLIGIVFFLPFLYFVVRRQIERPLAWKLAGIFVLGGLQGAMGWYMVASGLVDDPRVSQFRLTAHLALAVLIYAAILWTALDLLPAGPAPADPAASARLRWRSWAVTALVALLIVSGGFVAGIRAGRAYNTFPLMNGHVLPPEAFMLDPWYQNFFYNMATVQFTHRLFAWTLVLAGPWLWWTTRAAGLTARVRALGHLLLAAIAIQITLGITTLLFVVPVSLGTAHQAGALGVLTVVLMLNHALARTPGRRWHVHP